MVVVPWRGFFHSSVWGLLEAATARSVCLHRVLAASLRLGPRSFSPCPAIVSDGAWRPLICYASACGRYIFFCRLSCLCLICSMCHWVLQPFRRVAAVRLGPSVWAGCAGYSVLGSVRPRWGNVAAPGQHGVNLLTGLLECLYLEPHVRPCVCDTVLEGPL